ncbi:hypothetical protein MKZ38_009054 [Zalerion maritima]|uniref:Uncharacterized protein n=1 Tax=Zalerion maritima TaxID=339359 RepID=A0AAD5RTQ4_9PEZI|nr:hypothetical protein MKZ38_009054 [Zalerion maritima]
MMFSTVSVAVLGLAGVSTGLVIPRNNSMGAYMCSESFAAPLGCDQIVKDIGSMANSTVILKGESCLEVAHANHCDMKVCNYYNDSRVVDLGEFSKAFEDPLISECATKGKEGRWTPDLGPIHEEIDPQDTLQQGTVVFLDASTLNSSSVPKFLAKRKESFIPMSDAKRNELDIDMPLDKRNISSVDNKNTTTSSVEIGGDPTYQCIDVKNPPTIQGCEVALYEIIKERANIALAPDSCEMAASAEGCEISVCNYYREEKKVKVVEYADRISRHLVMNCVHHKKAGRYTFDGGPLNDILPEETEQEGIVVAVAKPLEEI